MLQQGTYPRGSLDVPANGQVVAGTISVAGWAVDLAAHDGTAKDRVQIYLDGTQVASADPGQSHPEIGAAYGENFTNSGWSAQVAT